MKTSATKMHVPSSTGLRGIDGDIVSTSEEDDESQHEDSFLPEKVPQEAFSEMRNNGDLMLDTDGGDLDKQDVADIGSDEDLIKQDAAEALENNESMETFGGKDNGKAVSAALEVGDIFLMGVCFVGRWWVCWEGVGIFSTRVYGG